MAQRVPLRAFFKIKNAPKTFEEARSIYSFFASKGDLLEFKFARDPDVKKIKDFGWISYKDSKITEQLFESWIKIEPHDNEAIIHRSDKGAKENQSLINKKPRSLPLIFGGFYLKDDKVSSPMLNNKNLTNENVQIGENILLEDSIEKIFKPSEEKDESTNYTIRI
ncbi:hypothetical protein RclHR1_00150035 [Rhizophagus clarus]|uniref:RRM domain-containing protein n=1 Tax=Rhizophagus clarus TaxID=94130 RepID=A0A2Z6QRI7_9GLOM|nr:hypothetical protein RclHR1_00150035 [Rhizophagus clarus]GET02318.1 hypothetical protein GLOIN_2v1476390 [Rhizophagus clarus]